MYLITEFCGGDTASIQDKYGVFPEFLVKYIMYQVFMAVSFFGTSIRTLRVSVITMTINTLQAWQTVTQADSSVLIHVPMRSGNCAPSCSDTSTNPRKHLPDTMGSSGPTESSRMSVQVRSMHLLLSYKVSMIPTCVRNRLILCEKLLSGADAK